jgi:LmbE family N-acetylglucosaminyl deacetylase
VANLTVLAIGAHPDPFDMAYQCGATLAKYARAGHCVIAVSAVVENEAEATRVGNALGVETRFLDLHEGAVDDDPATVRKVVDLIREVRPDLLITHQPTDYNPDHRKLSSAVLAAALFARVGEIQTAHPPFVVKALYYSDTTSGVNSDPVVYVDVTDTFDQKFAALALHVSLSEKAGVDHLGSIEHLIERDRALAATRGNQVEVEYAEAYRLAVNYRVLGGFEYLPLPDAPRAES